MEKQRKPLNSICKRAKRWRPENKRKHQLPHGPKLVIGHFTLLTSLLSFNTSNPVPASLSKKLPCSFSWTKLHAAIFTKSKGWKTFSKIWKLSISKAGQNDVPWYGEFGASNLWNALARRKLENGCTEAEVYGAQIRPKLQFSDGYHTWMLRQKTQAVVLKRSRKSYDAKLQTCHCWILRSYSLSGSIKRFTGQFNRKYYISVVWSFENLLANVKDGGQEPTRQRIGIKPVKRNGQRIRPLIEWKQYKTKFSDF